MPVNPNATFTFQSPDGGFTPAYEVTDDGIILHFVCANPGPGLPTGYSIRFGFSELAAISTQNALRNAVIDKLNTKIRATNIASKLDPFIGQSLTI